MMKKLKYYNTSLAEHMKAQAFDCNIEIVEYYNTLFAEMSIINRNSQEIKKHISEINGVKILENNTKVCTFKKEDTFYLFGKCENDTVYELYIKGIKINDELYQYIQNYLNKTKHDKIK